MRASVIIPARNAAQTIERTLEALAVQEGAGAFEVVVVDDGSEDETARIAERAGGNVTLVRQAGMGPGPARNRGVAASSGRVLAFTDADCFPQPSWLAEGLAALDQADLVQGRVEPEPGVAIGPFDRSIWVDGERGLFETANLLVRRSLFERLGGFEDWLGATMGKPLAEDIWFGWRARRAGARTAYCDSAVVHHAVFPRGPLAYVAERGRLVYFPAIAAKVPELRHSLFYGRLFLSRRSAALDAAVAGLGAARLTSSPLPLVATIPYLRQVARDLRGGDVRVAGTEVLADCVGFAALAIGSLRARSPLL